MLKMLRHSIAIIALTLCSTAAGANPFTQGDPRIGKQLVEKNCISCHASSFGGDGSSIYTRDNHLVKNPKGLLARIRTCNTNLGLKWFEDEEMHVAAYLNLTYYKFK